MIEITSTFARRIRDLACDWDWVLRVVGIALSANIIVATCVQADVNLADIVCWQCLPLPDAQTRAEQVRLTILPQLVGTDADFAKRLGFDSYSEVDPSKTEIDIPFVVFYVGLDRLKNYNPKLHDPATLLLDDTNWIYAPFPVPLRYLFPITTKVGHKIRSAAMVSLPILKNLPPAVRKAEIQWIGSPNLVTRVINCGATGVPTKTCDGRTYFIVWIPALNRYYLGRFEHGPSGNILKLTVLFRELGLPEGLEVPAGAVFQKLKPEAHEILNDPHSPPR